MQDLLDTLKQCMEWLDRYLRFIAKITKETFERFAPVRQDDRSGYRLAFACDAPCSSGVIGAS